MNIHTLEPIGQLFVIQDAEYVNKWLGAEGSHEFADVSDYDMACEVEDYMGKLDYTHNSLLIMGDEPMLMSVYELNQTHYFVRWMYAPKDFDITKHAVAIANMTAMQEIEDSVHVEFCGRDLVVHNASYAGKDDPSLYPFRALSNQVTVRTYAYQPDEETYIICHQLSYD